MSDSHPLAFFWHWLTLPIPLPGEGHVTPLAVLEFSVTLVVLWWVAIRLRKLLRQILSRRLDHATAYAISRISYYLIIAFGLLVALQTLGVNLSSLAIFGGVVGVGLGFGLQNIFSNFASGLILLFERSIKVGDYIQLKENGMHGMVTKLSVRYTQVKTNDHVDILVPNSQFVNGEVINWSLDEPVIRLHIPFRVPYGTDRKRLQELVVETARRSALTVDDAEHRPGLWITGFGDAGYDCEMIVWVNRDGLMRPGGTRAHYHGLLADALESAGIEIPRPRQEVVLAGNSPPAGVSAVSSSSSST